MTIYAAPGETYEATVTAPATGLSGTLGARVLDGQGGEAMPRTTGGILEVAPYVYTGTFDAPGTGGSYVLVWDIGGDLDPGSVGVEELEVAFGLVVGAAPTVLATLETLMAHRRRARGFAAGGGGTVLEHFTAETMPTLAEAQEATARHAGIVARDYPRATDDDATETVTIAATEAAIELELAQPNPDYERVRQWREQLKGPRGRLDARFRLDLADNPDGGAPGLSAQWQFPGDCGGSTVYDAAAYAEGSEVPLEPRRRRLRW